MEPHKKQKTIFNSQNSKTLEDKILVKYLELLQKMINKDLKTYKKKYCESDSYYNKDAFELILTSFFEFGKFCSNFDISAKRPKVI